MSVSLDEWNVSLDEVVVKEYSWVSIVGLRYAISVPRS
jgi:hypothetical protein